MLMKLRCLFLLLAACCLCALPAIGETVTLADDLSGVLCFPEGSGEADAAFVFRYHYPQVAGENDTAEMINQTYAAMAAEAVDFTAPILAETSANGETQSGVEIAYRVTCSSPTYLSVLFETLHREDDTEWTVYSANVFSLEGGKAGQVTSLPYLLGLLDAGETDTWLQDRQTAKADDCLRAMVWDRVLTADKAGEIALYPDVDYAFLEGCFYPEEDFYLTQEGDLVFFIQPGSVAPEEYGCLEYAFSMEDILDEL